MVGNTPLHQIPVPPWCTPAIMLTRQTKSVVWISLDDDSNPRRKPPRNLISGCCYRSDPRQPSLPWPIEGNRRTHLDQFLNKSPRPIPTVTPFKNHTSGTSFGVSCPATIHHPRRVPASLCPALERVHAPTKGGGAVLLPRDVS